MERLTSGRELGPRVRYAHFAVKPPSSSITAKSSINLPDGQITSKSCPACFAKIFRLTRRANQK